MNHVIPLRSLALDAAQSNAAAKVSETSAHGIFDRPVEPVQLSPVAAPPEDVKSDLDKYLLLAQEPMDTNVLQ